jgi:hypothetical protein
LHRIAGAVGVATSKVTAPQWQDPLWVMVFTARSNHRSIIGSQTGELLRDAMQYGIANRLTAAT